MGGKAVARTLSLRGCACLFGALPLAALLAAAGCDSPLARLERDPALDRALELAIEREIATFPHGVGPRLTEQPPDRVEQPLRSRLQELEAMGPSTDAHRTPFDLGPDLTGAEQGTVGIALGQAVRQAVQHNLGVEAARIQPAINAEQVEAAEAVFDFVLFASADLAKLDEPAAVPVINGIPIGTPFHAEESYRFTTGVRRTNALGGQVVVSTGLTRFRNNSPGVRFSPDPAYTADLTLGYTQPLLRNFGTGVNTAAIRIAENAQASAVEQLRADLLDVVDQTETAYWDLVYAWRRVEVAQWLVEVGTRVRDDLEARLEFDTTPAEHTDAVARVQRRKAEVILARRELRGASDRLKVLMNDPELGIGAEAVLEPTDAFVTAAIEYDLREAIITALSNRPEIEQELLRMDDRFIDLSVADRDRLPVLDVSAEVSFFGLDDNASNAFGDSFDDRFVDYILGLFFEYPIGNRGADATYRAARLARTQAYLHYRRTVQEIVLDVKSSLRDVVTSYELIGATRATRIASAENLRALIAEEPLRGMTPEFLDLKLSRQESLANARLGEFAALVEFDKALAGLQRAMGTALEAHRIEFEQVRESAMPEEFGIDLATEPSGAFDGSRR